MKASVLDPGQVSYYTGTTCLLLVLITTMCCCPPRHSLGLLQLRGGIHEDLDMAFYTSEQLPKSVIDRFFK